MRQMRMAAALMFAAAMALGVASCKDSMAPSILANMGGMDGVAKFMDNWKGAMAGSEALTKALSPDDMNLCAQGLVNEIAKSAEIPMPNAGVDLVQLLKDKQVSKDNLAAMGDALKTAAGTSNLSPDATSGITSLWNNAVKQVK